MRWLGGEHLAFFTKGCFDFNQGRPRARRNRELCGLVVDDATIRCNVQHLAVQLSSVEILRSAATDAQWPLFARRTANGFAEMLYDVIHQRPRRQRTRRAKTILECELACCFPGGPIRTAADPETSAVCHARACGRTPRSGAEWAPPCPDSGARAHRRRA